MAVHAGGLAQLYFPSHRARGKRDDRDVACRPRQRPDGAGRIKTIHDGHVHIHQDNIENTRRDRCNRRRAIVDEFDIMARLRQHPLDHHLVYRHVFRDQNIGRSGAIRRGAGLLEGFDRIRARQVELEPEAAAQAGSALDPDNPAGHGLDEAAADRQAQSGPAEIACGRAIDLRKRLEQQMHPVFRNADAGIDDLEEQAPVVLRRVPDFQNDASLPGEFDGVREQVEQNLTQPDGITDHDIGDVRRDQAVQVQRFLDAARANDVERAVDGIAQRQADGLEIQRARLDLREVENIIDDRKQRIAR